MNRRQYKEAASEKADAAERAGIDFKIGVEATLEDIAGLNPQKVVIATGSRPIIPDIPGLAVGYTIAENPFGLPVRTADAEGRLVWDPGVEWTGGGLASTAGDLARWGHALLLGKALDTPYLDRLLDGVAVAQDRPDALYGAGIAIYTTTPRGRVYGHSGWIPAYVSSLRHYADHGVTVAFQVNSDAGVVDRSSDLMPALEAALADLAIEASR